MAYIHGSFVLLTAAGPVPLAVGQVMVAAPVSSVSPPLPAVLLSQAPAGTEEMRVAEVAARQNLPDRSPRAASGLAPLSMDAAPGPDRLGGAGDFPLKPCALTHLFRCMQFPS